MLILSTWCWDMEKKVFPDLVRRQEEPADQIKLAVNGFRMDRVMFPLLRRVSNNLDCFHAFVFFAAPVEDPHLIKVRNVVELNREAICGDNLKQKSPRWNSTLRGAGSMSFHTTDVLTSTTTIWILLITSTRCFRGWLTYTYLFATLIASPQLQFTCLSPHTYSWKKKRSSGKQEGYDKTMLLTSIILIQQSSG